MSSLFRSTGVVALSTLASRIMGFVREILFANYFGASGSTDAFFIAWRIPNLLRRLVAEGGLTISFIPVYTEYRIKEGDSEALKVAQKTLTLLIFFVSIIVITGVIFSPEIVRLFGLGIRDESVLLLAADLNRTLFPYLLLVSFVAFSMGVCNSHGHFFAPAFAPVFLNIGMITGILLFTRFFDEPLYGVSAGVLFGGLCQVLLQIPYLVKSGFRMKISFDLKHPGIQKIFRLLGPAVFGIAVYQINILMGTILASMLSPGSISYLYYSDRLTEIVLGVFVVSIGNVILPKMSKNSAEDDIEGIKRVYRTSLSAALFLAIPAAAALMTVGFPVISVLFMRGEFSVNDALMTNRALFYASMGIMSVSILRITAPVFYSIKNTKIPVVAATIAFVINISLGYVLMHTSLQHAGLSLANAISVTVQVIFLAFFLKKYTGELRFSLISKNILKIISASIFMGMAVFYISTFLNWSDAVTWKRISLLLGIVVSGGGLYFLICLFLKVDETEFLLQSLKNRKS